MMATLLRRSCCKTSFLSNLGQFLSFILNEEWEHFITFPKKAFVYTLKIISGSLLAFFPFSGKELHLLTFPQRSHLFAPWIHSKTSMVEASNLVDQKQGQRFLTGFMNSTQNGSRLSFSVCLFSSQFKCARVCVHTYVHIYSHKYWNFLTSSKNKYCLIGWVCQLPSLLHQQPNLPHQMWQIDFFFFFLVKAFLHIFVNNMTKKLAIFFFLVFHYLLQRHHTDCETAPRNFIAPMYQEFKYQ